jgi:hypothetical protein
MLKSLLDGIGGAVGAALFSIMPSFIQQYTAGLSTCQSELARLADGAAAQPGGMAPDILATAQQRAAWCGNAAKALDSSTGLGRVVAFIHNFDAGVARATLHVFQPAVQMSADGLYFFIAGLVIGLVVLNVIVFPFRVFARRRRERLHYR